MSNMQPAPYPIRLALVTALVISLSGAGFVVSPAAACLANHPADADVHTQSDCCCADRCLCGPRCGAPDPLTQGDEQPSAVVDGQRLASSLSMLLADTIVAEDLAHAPQQGPAAQLPAEIAPLQTLFDQHTCLRA